MKILITGVLGFIGSHCARELIKDNYIVGLNRLSDLRNQMRTNEFVKLGNFKLIYADLAEDISGVCEGADIVIHFAAKTFVDHSILDPAPFIRSNIMGTYNLLEQSRRYRVKKFIYISTDEVYGPALGGYFKEDAPYNPTNPYSASKASAEALCISYYHTYGLPVIILRLENNYGIYQHPQKVIPVFIKKALNDEFLPVYGDGRHRRMWLKTEDTCSAIRFIIEKGATGEIYNIGGRQEYENIEVARMILSLLGKPHNLIQLTPDKDIRPGHDRRYAMDTSKIEQLGWKPAYTLVSGLPEVVEWYKNNQWWIK